jgi:hypothetical protein
MIPEDLDLWQNQRPFLARKLSEYEYYDVNIVRVDVGMIVDRFWVVFKRGCETFSQ